MNDLRSWIAFTIFVASFILFAFSITNTNEVRSKTNLALSVVLALIALAVKP